MNHFWGVNGTVKNDLGVLTPATEKELPFTEMEDSGGWQIMARGTHPVCVSFLYNWELRITFTFFQVCKNKTEQNHKEYAAEPICGTRNLKFIISVGNGDCRAAEDAGVGKMRS